MKRQTEKRSKMVECPHFEYRRRRLTSAGYMRTGDEAVIRKAPSGNEHVFIVDRIKELIKVKVGVTMICMKLHLTLSRATKSLPPSSKRTFLPILRSMTAL
jgi:hypothetical protein